MRNLPQQTFACLFILLSLLLGGCIESEDTFILNPDGSGKVVREMVFEPVEFFVDQDRPDKQQQLLDAVRDELQKAEGILAWSDVEYEWTDEERIRLRATGYFRNFNKVEFHHAGVDQKFLQKQIEHEGPNLIRITLKPEGSGDDGNGLLPTEDKEPITEANVSERIRKERAEFRRSRPFMAALFQGFKSTVNIRIPGEPREVSGFRQEEDHLSLTISGRNFLDGMEAMLEDEGRHREFLLMTEADQEKAINQMMTGEEGPFSALLSIEANQFDFEEELAAAREEYAALMETLGATPIEHDPEGPEAFGELERIMIAGIRWIPEEPGTVRGLRPFNYDAGLTLAMIAEFPKPVTEVSEVKLHRAITPAGVDLAPSARGASRSFSISIGSRNLSDDKRALSFDLRLQNPDQPVDTLAELSGVLVCRASTGTVEEDLGFERLAIGEEGKLFDAQLAESTFGWGDEEEFLIKLRINPSEIAELKFFDGDGNELEMTRRGSMTSGRSAEFTFAHKDPLPEDGRIVLIRHSALQQFEVPFRLENVSLVPGGR